MKGVLENEGALPLWRRQVSLGGKRAVASAIGSGASLQREILPSTDGAVLSRNGLLYAE
jgi:hypothetical protein